MVVVMVKGSDGVVAEGPALPCGDFVLRIGQLFLNASVSRTVVEVEYLPCSRAGAGSGLLREFVELLGEQFDFLGLDQSYADVPGLPAQFSRQHAALEG